MTTLQMHALASVHTDLREAEFAFCSRRLKFETINILKGIEDEIMNNPSEVRLEELLLNAQEALDLVSQ